MWNSTRAGINCDLASIGGEIARTRRWIAVMSAFGGNADIVSVSCEVPLITHYGHRSGPHALPCLRGRGQGGTGTSSGNVRSTRRWHLADGGQKMEHRRIASFGVYSLLLAATTHWQRQVANKPREDL